MSESEADIEQPVSWSRTQKALSAVLVVFTMLLGLLCVLMLSCTLTQTRMSAISISGVNITIWKLDDVRKQWESLRTEINAQSAQLAAAERKSGEAAAAYSAFDLDYRPARTEIDAKMVPFLARLQLVEPGLANLMKNEGPVERIERIESQREALIKAHPEFEGAIKEIANVGDGYKKIDATRIKLKSERDSRSGIVDSITDTIKSLQASLDNLFSAQFGVKPIDPQTRTRIENALFELYSGSMLGKLINSILVLPPEILTLFLVVLMGVLGSSLQLTHQLFVRKEADSIGVYSLRLCVGAITALVIFIVAKAGAPVITDASKLGGDAPINPYFVSFLAIISGLMSDKAIASVQRLGSKYFDTSESEAARWALPGLQASIAKSGRKAANLAQYLEVSATTLESWIAGKEQAPLGAQKTLSAVLDQPMRDLFSDLPPVDTKVTARGPETSASTEASEGDGRTVGVAP